MKNYFYLWWLSFSAMAVCTLPLSAAAVTQKESIMVDDLFSSVKPQCIGIYIIDVPESFNNSVKRSTYDDFKIESQFMYPPAFKQQITRREQELNDAINNPRNKIKNAPFIKEIIRLPGERGVIFDRNQSGFDDAYRMLEAYIYVNNISFVIKTKILDLSDNKYSEERKFYSSVGFSERKMNDKPTKLAALKSLISRLSGRPDQEVPTRQGICIPNGFIEPDGGKHISKVGFNYNDTDFSIGFNTNNTLIADGDTLFGRSDGLNAALRLSGMKTLRKYTLTPNGIPAEAWLAGGAQNNDERLRTYNFILYANEAVATADKPLIKAVLNNKNKQTRYSEAQMLDIWDRITGTLRYRQNYD